MRVAVVDDSEYDRSRMAASLRESKLRTNPPTRVEVTHEFSDSREVVTSIEAREDRWDIILSDVMMPHLEDGAFRIADAIDRTYGAESPIKLAAVTSKSGFVAASPQLARFNDPRFARWFWFFPKGEDVAGPDMAGDLLESDAWELALATMVELLQSETWGLGILRAAQAMETGTGPVVSPEDDFPTYSRLTRSVFVSASSAALIPRIAELGQQPEAWMVFLAGESRCGKGLLARLLHAHRMSLVPASERGRFVSLPPMGTDVSLGRSQMFGHRRGSFSGANENVTGYFNAAANGTLFIDEIGKRSAEEQQGLLPILEERGRELHPVGAPGTERRVARFTARLVILATDEPLEEIASGSHMIAQLYNRVRPNEVRVPALRDRADDVVAYARVYLDELNGYGPPPTLTDDALEWLRTPRAWPGNFTTLEGLLAAASHRGRRREVSAALLERSANNIPGFHAPIERRAVPHAIRRGYGYPDTPEQYREMIQAWLAQHPEMGPGDGHEFWIPNQRLFAEHFGLQEDALFKRIRKHPDWPEPGNREQRIRGRRR